MVTNEFEKFIESKGGAAKLARVLKLPKLSGTQTVHNWKTRGFPALIVLNNPKVFKDYINKMRKTA